MSEQITGTWACPSCFNLKPKEIQDCPHCHFKEDQLPNWLYLPYRSTVANRFLSGRILGKGAYSVIYLVQELDTHAPYVLKEYFPRKVGQRRPDGYVLPRTGFGSSFIEGFETFREERDILSEFDHESIVRCYEAIEANGTIYLLLDFYGFNNLELICRQQSKLGEHKAMELMSPVLGALETIHATGLLHCDVNPSNILNPEQGPPVLLDFGSAQFQDGERSLRRPLTVTYGYSAPEQHSQKTNLYRPWTDVYSCAATLYRLTTGKAPPPASARVLNDTLESPRRIVPSLSDEFSRAVMQGLCLNPDARPATAEEFRGLLGDGGGVSPIYTVRNPGPETSRAEEVRQRLVGYIPSMLLLAVVLSALYLVLRPIKITPGFSHLTGPTSTVRPTDFYILRDASSSIEQTHYDLIEAILLDGMRLEDETDGSADFTAYAHFAAWVTSGAPKEKWSLQAAARGNNIERIRAKLQLAKLPANFSSKTDFARLFESAISALQARKVGSIGDDIRESVVAVITDGMPDQEGNRPSCIDLALQNQFFNDRTEKAFLSLSRSGANIVVLLIGGIPECMQTIESEWIRLKQKALPAFQGKIAIVSLDGYAGDRERMKELIQGAIRRNPYISVRPSNAYLSDDQRRWFDTTEDFYTDFVFQPHLVNGVDIQISAVEVLNEKKEIIATLDVINGGVLYITSPGGPRNGSPHIQTLRIGFAGHFKPNPREKYWLSPEVTAHYHNPLKSLPIVLEGQQLAELSLGARKAEIQIQRLEHLAWISGMVAVAFSTSLASFWRIGKKQKWMSLRRVLKSVFIRPLRFWLLGFLALSSILLIAGGKYLSSGWMLWGIIAVIFLLLHIRHSELIMKQNREQISRAEIIVSCFDAILVPLISVLLTLVSPE